MNKLTHLNAHGAARMVDVSTKTATAREAAAEAIVVLSKEAFDAVLSGDSPKGDVFAAARLAGIMAAKKTAELIPLCHPIALTKAGVEIEPLPDRHALSIIASAKTRSETGVEMEALTAAAVAALTIYDMVKAIDRGAVIESVRLLSKTGGKSGAYKATSCKPRSTARRPGPTTSAVFDPVARARPAADVHGAREALRGFMTDRRLRATQWAKTAGVPAAHIFAFLTGRARSLPPATAEALARTAHVRVEDLFARRTP
jgi:cyclic pyranopterin phosphate synthase